MPTQAGSPSSPSGDSKKPVTITVDSRESNSQIPRMLGSMPHVTLVVEQLDEGDYIPGPGVIVERKAADDFAASIMDGRLMSQAKLMKANHETVVIMLEGDLRSRRSAIPDESLRGALSYLSTLLKCSIVPTDNPMDSAQLIARMALHLQHGLASEVPLQVAKPRDLTASMQFIVESLPGVGPGLAKALLDHFGSVQAIMGADEASLTQVPRLGAKTASRIRETLTRDVRVGK